MTDAPKLPPFPEKPEHMPGLWWEYYYRDLAAAWEAVARRLYDDASALTDPEGELSCVPDGPERRDLEDTLRVYSTLPPKEG